MSTQIDILPGKSYPLGATYSPSGVNFSIFSKNATSIELLLFDSDDHSKPAHVILLDPKKNRTYHYWHAFLPGLKNGQLYAYRVYGPYDEQKGYRFDGDKVLLDPYSKAVVSDTYERQAACVPGDNCAVAMKSVVVDHSSYDWGDDEPLNHSFSHSVIYELHPSGFTKHPNSGLPEDLRGTYRGLIEKIPYLKALGITTVELMPVQQFDPMALPNKSLVNYWGYSPIALFAPHNGYACSKDPLGLINEFKDMVKAFHRANISIILDVVFNHTAEDNHEGPTICFRGVENIAYYILEDDMAHYKNFTGTGNTVRANHSVVRRMIRECLDYWVAEFHVDGFRFDLASVLSRDEMGNHIEAPPIVWSIDSGPVLASSKIIAEAWDLHLYQLGNFVGDRWAEWNGKFRDDIRKFMKGDNGMAESFSLRLGASIDLFKDIFRDPNRSINFITCHDGFTLNDLVTYNQKYNAANGEGNRDGSNDNHSWNCGVEGPTNDLAIEQLRIRQIKNFLTLLLIAQGTPMLSMGDEIRRTQLGNNNAYCQDNELSWFDWDLVKKNAALLDFVKKLIQLNLKNPFFQEETFWVAPEPIGSSNFSFHGTKLHHPDWSYYSHSLAFNLRNIHFGKMIHVMINAHHEALQFEIPNEPGLRWKKLIDTFQTAPNDILSETKAKRVDTPFCEVQPRSIVLLCTEID